jgi:nucleoside-diphosphate-sugar epimerase
VRSLVTGGAGFIGSHLVDRLLDHGDEVRVLDNFSTGNRANLAEVEDHVDLVEGDLRSYERVHRAVRGCDIGGTLNVLLAARDEGVGRVVFASSSSIYGNLPGLPRVETQAVAPISPYAVSKLAAEQYCRSAWEVYGLETVSLRYFNIFGPRQDPKSQYSAVIPKFIAALLRGDRPTIYGTGEQSRDFTYVDNAVEANLLAAVSQDVGGMVFNLGTGTQHSINELVATLQRLTGSSREPVYEESRLGDLPRSWADVSLANRVLGYDPSVGFEDGLLATIEAVDRTAAVD